MLLTAASADYQPKSHEHLGTSKPLFVITYMFRKIAKKENIVTSQAFVKLFEKGRKQRVSNDNFFYKGQFLFYCWEEADP